MEFKFNGKTFNGKDYQKFIDNSLISFIKKIDNILEKLGKINRSDLESGLSETHRTILSDIRNKNINYYKNKFDILNECLKENNIDLLSKEFIKLFSTFDDIIRKIKFKINNIENTSALDILVFTNSLKHMKIHIEKMIETNKTISFEDNQGEKNNL